MNGLELQGLNCTCISIRGSVTLRYKDGGFGARVAAHLKFYKSIEKSFFNNIEALCPNRL